MLVLGPETFRPKEKKRKRRERKEERERKRSLGKGSRESTSIISFTITFQRPLHTK